MALATTTADEALSILGDRMRVVLGSGAATPVALLRALCDRARGLAAVEVCHLLTLGAAPYVAPDLEGHLRHNAFFVGPNTRAAVQEGRADFTPVFLSEIAALFRRSLPVDVALIQVSPPDEHGFCSLGVSVDIVKPAVDAARFVVAEINPQMPRAHGDAFVHVKDFDRCVAVDHPIPELLPAPIGEVERAIGKNVAELVRDGDTLQVGIGAIPDAALAAMRDHRDLGVHTEMFSDGIVDLVKAGVVTNAQKSLHPGKLVTSFVMGTRKVYDFIDDNPSVEMHPSSYVNDPRVIADNDGMVAINSALSIDLTGQVCADSIGAKIYSGVGGQVDFIRGASRARGGRAIVAMPSTAKAGAVSRIAVELAPGSGVTTSCSDVRFVVTEYGIADLHGRSIRDRVRALVGVAHPRFRDELIAGARERRWI